MSYTPSLEELIIQLAKFPGIGEKSAERLAFHILKSTKKAANALCESIINVKEKTHFCQNCFYLCEETLCKFCSNPRRDHSVICVVENFKDVISIEKTLDYQGIYHVLMGHISPSKGMGIKHLTIQELTQRIEKNAIKEVILATNPNTEGDTTALCIAKQLENYKLQITRIARGLPIGADLQFADPLTLSKSIAKKKKVPTATLR